MEPQGYKPEDVWNEDETGCFYRDLSEKTVTERKRQYKGGNKDKEGSQLPCFANTAGSKELPVVTGKPAKLWCFRRIRNPQKPTGIP